MIYDSSDSAIPLFFFILMVKPLFGIPFDAEKCQVCVEAKVADCPLPPSLVC